jgi:hypothetical protein
MRKLLTMLLLILIATSSLGALSITTKIDDISMHPDIWAGLFPSYVAYKFIFDIPKLIEDKPTELSVLLSTGTVPRVITQNPLNGYPAGYGDQSSGSELIDSDYDVFASHFSIKFSQGFLGPKKKKPSEDKLQLWASLDGQWEQALDPIMQAADRTGHPFSSSIFQNQAEGNVFPGTPDLSGDQRFITVSYNIGMDLETMLLYNASGEGTNLHFQATLAPASLGSLFAGKADYWRVWLFGQTAFTLYKKVDTADSNIWSLVLQDEFECRVLDGKMVPKFAEKTETKVWGIEPINATFVARNSLKLYYYGQQFFNKSCVPLVYIFFDIGYAGGWINNTSRAIGANSWQGSYGIHLSLQILEMFHIYYEGGYVFLAGNDTDKVGFVLQEGLKFFLSFPF